MSKKVVHLADDAHELAKAHCKDSGMKMSDWVAMLIKRAVEPPPQVVAQAAPPAPSHPAIRESAPPRIAEAPRPQVQVAQQSVDPSLPKKKPMLRELSSENEDSVPVYSQPPFWARSKSS